MDLSKQEYCVIELLNRGCSSKLIAKMLDISIHTVNGHTKSIYFKWNVRSRGQAQHKFNEYLAMVAAKEAISQGEDKAAQASELAIANTELVFQAEHKAARASELAIANTELVFQTEEKSKRASELVIANEDKAARASELAIANTELLFQTEEKSKRASELVIANEDKAAQASELAIANTALLLLERALFRPRPVRVAVPRARLADSDMRNANPGVD